MKHELINKLKCLNKGNANTKKRRLSHINKFCDVLIDSGYAPKYLSGLDMKHIRITFDLMNDLKISEAYRYAILVDLRFILKHLNFDISNVNYTHLNIQKPLYNTQRPCIDAKLVSNITDNLSKLIVSLILYFGLSFEEATSVIPDIHVFEKYITLTREITSNNIDKSIPIFCSMQSEVIRELISVTEFMKSLGHIYSKRTLKELYQSALNILNISNRNSLQFYYARMRFSHLSNLNLSKNHCLLKISRELGIHHRNIRGLL